MDAGRGKSCGGVRSLHSGTRLLGRGSGSLPPVWCTHNLISICICRFHLSCKALPCKEGLPAIKHVKNLKWCWHIVGSEWCQLRLRDLGCSRERVWEHRQYHTVVFLFTETHGVNNLWSLSNGHQHLGVSFPGNKVHQGGENGTSSYPCSVPFCLELRWHPSFMSN